MGRPVSAPASTAGPGSRARGVTRVAGRVRMVNHPVTDRVGGGYFRRLVTELLAKRGVSSANA